MSYIQSLDTKLGTFASYPYYYVCLRLNIPIRVGEKVLGPEKTLSGKAQETLQSATQQAKAVDEQRGISRTATDVSVFVLSPNASCDN